MNSYKLTRTKIGIAIICGLLVFLLLPVGARAQFQTVTIPVGNGPIALALNQTTHLLYVANQTANSVSVIDTNVGNPTFNTVVAGPIFVGTKPFAIAVNAATNRIYVANSGSANVSVIDGTSNTVIATIQVNILNPSANPPTTFAFHPSALAVNQNTNQIYVGNADCAFAAIDGNTNAVRHPNYPDLCNENAVAVNPATNTIYVASQGDSDIEMFNETNAGGVFSNTFVTGFDSNQPIALAVDTNAGQIYVADLTGLVEVIDETLKKEIVNTSCISLLNGLPVSCFGIATPSTPYAVAVNPNTGKAYVLNQNSAGGPATLSVISANPLTGGAILSNITVGNSALPVRIPAADKVLVDPVRNLVYVANDGSNTVTWVDGNTDTVTFTLPTGGQPFALAEDATTGYVYVANFSSGTSGSVTVLEVAPSSANLFATTSYTFGPQAVGTTSTAQLVNLINRGPNLLTVNSIVRSGDFSETDNCLSSSNPPIPVGGSCTIQVTFTPSAAGTRTGQLIVTDSDPSSPQVISLSGTGTGAGLTVTPSTIGFGATIINQGSSQQGVTVTNTGAIPLVFQFTSTSVTGDFSWDNGCTPPTSATTFTVAPGGACTIEAQFFPTAGGVRAGQLIITDYSSGSGVNYTVPLTGYGIAAQGVQPLGPSLVFGSQLVGTTSPGLVETLTNVGFSNLAVRAVTASGDFAVGANNCVGAMVAPQTSCEFIVYFTPARGGTREGQVLIFDNQNYSPQVVTLSGAGSPAGVTLAPATLSFGTQAGSVQGLPQSVTLTNTGTSNLTITSITPDGDENWLETDTCVSPAFGPIAPGASCTITVTEEPLTIGRLTGLGQLIIVDSDPSSPHFIGLASAGTGLQLSVSPSFLSGPGALSVSDTLFQPLISKVQAVGAGWTESDTCSPPAFTLTTCTVTVSGGTGVGQITIDDVNHTNSPMIVALAGPYSIASLVNTPTNAPLGPAVTVSPIDPGTGTSPVSLTFPSGSVTTGGITSLTIQSGGPQPPSGFQLGTPPVYYYVQTTALFSGNLTICITSPSVTSTSQLFHFGSTGTVNITSSVTPPTICGVTTSFSPFAIAQRTSSSATLNTTLASSANPSVYGQAVTLTAGLEGTGTQTSLVPTPTGTIAFYDGATQLGSPFTLSGSPSAALTISTLTAGSYTITAQYSGDSNYEPSNSSSFSLTVNQATTSLGLASAVNPAAAGQTVTFNAVLTGTTSSSPGVLSPTGSVLFLDGGTPLGVAIPLSTYCSAAFMTSALAPGTHTITAQYKGDANYTGSGSSPITQMVNKNPTSTSLASSSTSPTVGQAITLTSAVSSAGTGSLPAGIPAPTGFVTFLDGSTPLASAVPLPSSGPATLTLSTLTAGTHTLTAQYSGDGIYNPSTSPVVIETVNGVSTITAISETNVIYGTASSVTVTVLPSSGNGTVTGNVTLSVDGGAASSAVLSAGSATFSLGVLKAGNHSLVANFAAQGGFPSSSGQATLVVTQASPTITWASPAPIPYGTALGAAQLNAASVPGTFTYIPAAATVLGVGSHTLSTTFTPADTVDYTSATAQVTITVSPAPLTITANNATKLLNAANPTFTWTPSGFVNGDTTAVLTLSPTCNSAAGANSPVGSYSITCSGAGATNYTFSYVAGTLRILYAAAIGHIIQPPINADGSSVFNRGRTIPAKFSVYDANGVSIGTPGVVSKFLLTGIQSGTVTSTVETVVDTNNPDTAFRWDPNAQQWIFNITTANLAAGSTYIYTITLNDGSMIIFQYGLL